MDVRIIEPLFKKISLVRPNIKIRLLCFNRIRKNKPETIVFISPPIQIIL